MKALDHLVAFTLGDPPAKSKKRPFFSPVFFGRAKKTGPGLGSAPQQDKET